MDHAKERRARARGVGQVVSPPRSSGHLRGSARNLPVIEVLPCGRNGRAKPCGDATEAVQYSAPWPASGDRRELREREICIIAFSSHFVTYLSIHPFTPPSSARRGQAWGPRFPDGEPAAHAPGHWYAACETRVRRDLLALSRLEPQEVPGACPPAAPRERGAALARRLRASGGPVQSPPAESVCPALAFRPTPCPR